jgi:hypothetical protein
VPDMRTIRLVGIDPKSRMETSFALPSIVISIWNASFSRCNGVIRSTAMSASRCRFASLCRALPPTEAGKAKPHTLSSRLCGQSRIYSGRLVHSKRIVRNSQ